MQMRLSGVPAPPVGAWPDFDEHVDYQLSEMSDMLDEQTAEQAEYLEWLSAGECSIADDLAQWHRDRIVQLRSEMWEVWIGLAGACEEAAALREQLEAANREKAVLAQQLTESTEQLSEEQASHDLTKLALAQSQQRVEMLWEANRALSDWIDE